MTDSGSLILHDDEDFLEVAKSVAESTNIQYILATLHAMQEYIMVHFRDIQASVLDDTAALLHEKLSLVTAGEPQLGEAVEQALHAMIFALRPCTK
jgi:hypothetical protein